MVINCLTVVSSVDIEEEQRQASQARATAVCNLLSYGRGFGPCTEVRRDLTENAVFAN